MIDRQSLFLVGELEQRFSVGVEALRPTFGFWPHLFWFGILQIALAHKTRLVGGKFAQLVEPIGMQLGIVGAHSVCEGCKIFLGCPAVRDSLV